MNDGVVDMSADEWLARRDIFNCIHSCPSIFSGFCIPKRLLLLTTSSRN